MQVNYPPAKYPLLNTQQPGLLGLQQPQTPLATLAAPPVTDPNDPSSSFTELNPLKQHQEMAAAALEAGSNVAPARGGWIEGLARLAQAYTGGRMMNQANTDISTAKQHNSQVMLDAVNNGEWGKLATADDPQANKLGDSLLTAQLKHMQTERPLTKQEIKDLNLPEGTVGVKKVDGGFDIKYNPALRVPRDWMSDGAGGLQPIPGGPADPTVIKKTADLRRKPVVTKPDESGLAPWLRKY